MRVAGGNGAWSGLEFLAPLRSMRDDRDGKTREGKADEPLKSPSSGAVRTAANTDHPGPGGYEPLHNVGGLDDLAKRISVSPVLREHLIWAAVPLLEPMTGLRDAPSDFRAFSGLMEREAHVEALLRLASRLAPNIALSRLVRSHGVWLCRAQVVCKGTTGERTQRCFRAVHSDAPAAMLLAILIAASPAWSSAR